jgi:hypothetical protein
MPFRPISCKHLGLRPREGQVGAGIPLARTAEALCQARNEEKVLMFI